MISGSVGGAERVAGRGFVFFFSRDLSFLSVLREGDGSRERKDESWSMEEGSGGMDFVIGSSLYSISRRGLLRDRFTFAKRPDFGLRRFWRGSGE